MRLLCKVNKDSKCTLDELFVFFDCVVRGSDDGGGGDVNVGK